MDMPNIFSPLSIDNLPPLTPQTPSDFSEYMDYFETNVLQQPKPPAPTLDFSLFTNDEILHNLQSAVSKSPSTSSSSTTTTLPIKISQPLPSSSSTHFEDFTIKPSETPPSQPQSSPTHSITLSPASSTTNDIESLNPPTVQILPPPTISLPFPFPIYSTKSFTHCNNIIYMKNPPLPTISLPESHPPLLITSHQRKSLLPTPETQPNTSKPAPNKLLHKSGSSRFSPLTSKIIDNTDLRSIIEKLKLKHKTPPTTTPPLCSINVFTVFKSPIQIPKIFPYNKLQFPRISTLVRPEDLTKPQTFKDILISVKDFCLQQPTLKDLKTFPQIVTFLQPSISYPTSPKESHVLLCDPDALPFQHQEIISPYFMNKDNKITMTATFVLPHFNFPEK